MANIGKITYVDANSVDKWKYEPDFSRWLADEGLDFLQDTLGMQLENTRIEVPVGRYKADIVATDADTGKPVIVENKYNTFDHDHLGKALTYAAGIDPQTIVWIVEDVYQEHQDAISWLNKHLMGVQCFLIKLSVCKIGNSDPAPLFTILECPKTFTAQAESSTSVSSGRTITDMVRKQQNFIKEFLDYGHKNPEFSAAFPNASPNKITDNYVNLSTGSYHNSIKAISKNGTQVMFEIWIANNKDLYNAFESNKEEIEKIVGMKLEWTSAQRSCRIFTTKGPDWADPNEKQKCFEWSLETALKFNEAFSKFSQKYRETPELV